MIVAHEEDTLELVAGDNVTLTPDIANKKVRISSSAGTLDYDDLINKPQIGGVELADDTTLADIGAAADADLAAVAKSGSYTDLDDKPTIPAAQIQSDWNQSDNTAKDFIKNKPAIPAAQIQSDWNQTNTAAKDFIKNKPVIPTSIGGLGDVNITSPSDGQVIAYNSTLQEWVNMAAPSGGSRITQPFTFDSGFNGQTLSISKDGTALTPVVLDNSGELTLYFDNPGTYTYSVTASYGWTFTETVTYNYVRQYDSIYIIGKAPMYPFTTATDDQLAAMLKSYYGGAYDAADIATLKSTYLSIGMKRTIHLSKMTAGDGCVEEHFGTAGADYEFTIIGFEHDNLATPSIGGKTKALLTLQQDRILYKNTTDGTYSSNYPSTADGGGQMNTVNTNVGGWKECPRRAWCNNTYFNALPSAIRNLVKQVKKITSIGNQSQNMDETTDKTFLLSEQEIFGTKTYSAGNEGTQYQYYTTASNRYKKPSYSSYASATWWERSPYLSNATQFCGVNSSGSAGYGNAATNAYGLAPAFCI